MFGSRGHAKSARLLIERGSDVNAETVMAADFVAMGSSPRAIVGSDDSPSSIRLVVPHTAVYLVCAWAAGLHCESVATSLHATSQIAGWNNTTTQCCKGWPCGVRAVVDRKGRKCEPSDKEGTEDPSPHRCHV